MPSILLIALSIIVGVITFLVICGAIDRVVNGLWVILCAALSLGIAGWWVIASQEAYIVEVDETFVVRNVEGPNGMTQVVSYKDYDEVKFLNVNKHFGCQVPEGTKIHYTRYAKGPYAGIYFTSKTEKWEIVK